MAKYFTNLVKLYSVALFEYGVKKKITHKLWEDFTSLKGIFCEDSSIIGIISAPIYSEDEQSQILTAVLKKFKLSDEMTNFIYMLVRNKRMAIFPLILEYFYILMNDSEGRKMLEVTLCSKASIEEQLHIEKCLEKVFSAKIEASFKEDEKILAGIIVKTDNKMFDASLRTKLTDLTDSVSKKIALL